MQPLHVVSLFILLLFQDSLLPVAIVIYLPRPYGALLPEMQDAPFASSLAEKAKQCAGHPRMVKKRILHVRLVSLGGITLAHEEYKSSATASNSSASLSWDGICQERMKSLGGGSGGSGMRPW
jgi:hypothetical protein